MPPQDVNGAMTFQYPPVGFPQQHAYDYSQSPMGALTSGFYNPAVSYNPNTALQQPLLVCASAPTVTQPQSYSVSVSTGYTGHGNHGSHHYSGNHGGHHGVHHYSEHDVGHHGRHHYSGHHDSHHYSGHHGGHHEYKHHGCYHDDAHECHHCCRAIVLFLSLFVILVIICIISR